LGKLVANFSNSWIPWHYRGYAVWRMEGFK